MRTHVLTSLFVLLAISCVPASTRQNSASSTWQTIAFHDLFTFPLPAGFVTRSAISADDTRAEYYNGETKLVVVWGHTESRAFSERRQQWMNDYEESTTRIGGQRANIRTYSQTVKATRIYHAELNVGNWEKGEVQLYMGIESNDPAILEVARQIFKSVVFPIPPPNN